jgi:hypothetical protein
MYLNYDEYQSKGGTLDETAFNYYGFEAHQIILNATHNRIAEASEAVKACMFKLIELASNFDVTKNGRVTSSTHDGLSQSFAVPTSAEYLKETNDIIKSYLLHEVDEKGIPLLYVGVNAHD